MKVNHSQSSRSANRIFGITLVEVTVATGVASIVMVFIALLVIYGARSFLAMSNYVDLDLHSRNALDNMTRELRQATAVVSTGSNSTLRSVTLTNSQTASTLKVTWNTDARTLVFEQTGEPPRTFLTECDNWTYAFYNRAPAINSTNLSFNTATNVSNCKVMNMSWKCSRTILGSKVNTESVQTAQIVLRNKVR